MKTVSENGSKTAPASMAGAKRKGNGQERAREDCVFCVDRRCRILSPASCEGCAFFKTPAQLARSREKSGNRLRALLLRRKEQST